MRKLVFIFICSIAVIQTFPQDNYSSITDKIAWQEKTRFTKELNFRESTAHSLTDFIYHRMEWEIDPRIHYIKGRVTTYFKSKTQNLSEIEFDLDGLMSVDSVIHHNQKISFNHADNKLQIALPGQLNVSDIDSISVFYQGKPNTTGFGAFAQTWHSNVPVIWTLSEPYGAMEWWPCKQSLSDKIDSTDIIVTCPDQYRTASIGVLKSETVKENKRIMHWKHRYPVATYLVAIAVTNYVIYSDFLETGDDKKIEILNYVYPESLTDAQNKTPVTADIMEIFNNLVGEYPFADEKYGHAQFGFGGGMEHQTMSFMNNFEFGLISHELAHQWFGDYITLGSWQDIWLNEGFATYLTGVSVEHLLKDSWLNWKKDRVERITSSPGGSVFVKDTTSIGTIFSSRLSYSKGAYLLMMLRWILGDETFYSGIRNYFDDPAIANGFARTNQFVKHMENVADTSLTEFFNDWYYGEGYPEYSAMFTSVSSNRLRIKLSQTPSHNSVDFFEMPVPVRLFNADKSESTDVRLMHTHNEQEFIIETDFYVSDIEIDPEYWIVTKSPEITNVPLSKDSDEITIFPNPFLETVFAQIPSGQTLLNVKIFSADGKLLTSVGGDNKYINLANMPAGIYLFQINTTENSYIRKGVKR